MLSPNAQTKLTLQPTRPRGGSTHTSRLSSSRRPDDQSDMYTTRQMSHINNRALIHINITDAQARGKEGISTTDHLLILKEIINTPKRKKKPFLLTYLDVRKAYDKAWLDGIMYALHNNGVMDQHGI